MQKKFPLVLLFLLSFYFSHAQKYRLTFAPELNVPIGKLAWSYKASPGIKIGFERYGSRRHQAGTRKVFGASIGYTQIKPLADTLYFVADDGAGTTALGTAVFTSFQMLNVQAHFGFEIPLTKKTYLVLSAGAGITLGMRTVDIDDHISSESSSSELVEWLAVTPKIGLLFELSKHWSISPSVSYTLMVQAGSTDEDSASYNPDTGKMYSFYSPNITLNYTF